MFLKLDGIPGESKDSAHKDTIDILSWSWGMSQSGSTHDGGGSGAGKVNVQDISVTKYVDKASCALMSRCASGKHITTGLLTVRKAGDTPLEYLKITIEDMIVAAVSTGGSGGEDRLTENVTLNFAKVKVDYQEQKPDGTGTPAGNMGWNIKENVKW